MSDQTGQVSVIIPTYNRAHLIGQSIESVLNQTYRAVEVIVVDDGSSDNTKDVVTKYGDRVRYIYQKNAGPSAARNNGVNNSSAEFIGFLDSDDVYLPTKLEKQVTYLNNHPDIDVVLCHWSFVGEDRVTIVEEVSEVPADDMLKRILLTGIWGYFPPNVPLLRRSSFVKAGGFIESLPAREEQAFWMHVALVGGKFATIEESLCYMMATPNSRGKNIPNVALTMPLILDSVFKHPQLPEDVARLKSEIYARWYLDLGFGFLARSKDMDGSDMDRSANFIKEGVALNPSNEAWRKVFIEAVGEKVITSVSENEAEAYLDTLLKRMFPNTGTPSWVIHHIVAHIHAALAFRAYSRKDRRMVLRHVSQAIINQPSLLKNRGISSILIKSFLPTT
jgi:glycosyltransferase involved in cell wall biosynthesis